MLYLIKFMKTGCELLTEYNDNLKLCEIYPPLYSLQILPETFVAAILLSNIRPGYTSCNNTNEMIIKLNQVYKDTIENYYGFPRKEIHNFKHTQNVNKRNKNI